MKDSIKLPELISEEKIKEIKKMNTTLISDAMDVKGSMSHAIKPVNPNNKLIGTAITIKVPPGDNLSIHKMIYAAKEGYVLVIDGGGHEANAYLGELMVYAAQAIGLEGIVIDGLIRDWVEIYQKKYPVFSKGYISTGPKKENNGQINIPIDCGGVKVNPGDFVVGDADGVVVVPRNDIDEVIKKAKMKQTYENNRLKIIAEYVENKKKGVNLGRIAPDWIDD